MKQPNGKGVTFNFYGPKMDLPLGDAQTARRKQLQDQHDQINGQLEQRVAAAIPTLQAQILAPFVLFYLVEG